jgi:hypothetical protein
MPVSTISRARGAERGRTGRTAQHGAALGAEQHRVQNDHRQRFGGLVGADLAAALALGEHLGGDPDRGGHLVAEGGGQAARAVDDLPEHGPAQRRPGYLPGRAEHGLERPGQHGLGVHPAVIPAAAAAAYARPT